MDVYGTPQIWLLEKLLQATRNSYKACGQEEITVSTIKSLTPPANAVYALISLESDATGIAIRYLELGAVTPPTSTVGLGKSNLDTWDVVDTANLVKFRAIAAQAGTHVLHIQYYSFT